MIASIANRFWATVCKMVRPMLSDRCPVLSCLSLYVGVLCQTVGRIKMKLGMQVDFIRPWPPPHCVSWEPAPLPQRCIAPNFRPMSIVAKRLHGSICHFLGGSLYAIGPLPVCL